MKLILNFILLSGLVVCGYSAEKKPAVPLEVLRQKADKGDVLAAYELAERVMMKEEKFKNHKVNMRDVVKWYKTAYRDPSLRGKIDARVMQIDKLELSRGHDFSKNYWCDFMVQFGHRQCLYHYAERLLGSRDKSHKNQGLLILKEVAEKGNHTDSAEKLFQLYCFGGVVKKDLKKAKYWYQKAAEFGDSVVKARLGKAIVRGRYGFRESRKGFNWLEQAKNNGDTSALFTLGKMNIQGLYLDKDEIKGWELCSQAIENGNYEAKEYLDKLKKDGKLAGLQTKLKNHLLQSYQKQPTAELAYRLGRYFLNNISFGYDETEGLNWLKTAAVSRHADAKYQLYQYYSGKTGKDFKDKADVYLKNAAKHGNAKAQVEFGNRYLVIFDLEKAKYWYLESIKKHEKQGYSGLARICMMSAIGLTRENKTLFEVKRLSAMVGNKVDIKIENKNMVIEALKWNILAEKFGMDARQIPYRDLFANLSAEQIRNAFSLAHQYGKKQ